MPRDIDQMRQKYNSLTHPIRKQGKNKDPGVTFLHYDFKGHIILLNTDQNLMVVKNNKTPFTLLMIRVWESKQQKQAISSHLKFLLLKNY